METTRNMKSDAPQMPGTLELPPATAVPPITTTAIDIRRYSDAHVERGAAGEAGEQIAADRGQHGAEDIGDEARTPSTGMPAMPRGRHALADRRDPAAVDRLFEQDPGEQPR